ncbi:MAG: VWA domain-containing protein [Gemmatimonadetes bacterium]|nr:VWA domain-containing protein [Gemmatimonadota bacterium]
MRTLFTVVAALAVSSPLLAQGWIEPAPGIRCECAVQRTRTVVSVRVTGRIARVEVEEWFRNQGGILGQGDYLYPLPGEAVFSNFSLFQGDQELTGETMDAGQARSIYEEIVRRKRDPALIELAGHGLIRARVFPINPGETRKITLRYTQLLARAGDALQFRYAAGRQTGLTPRLGVEAPSRAPEAAPLSFQMVLDSAGQFRDPFSPTHQVHTDRMGARLTVRAPENLAGDFTLFLPLARGLVGLTLATHRPSSEDGYFMLTLSPGNGRGEAAAQPRDVTAVVDVSGSMSGSKITQARGALRQLLASLNRSDRFRLIAFSGNVRSYRGGWTQATADAVSAAQRWVEQLTADGGTNIEGALREAFSETSPEQRLPIVLFVTDGLPSVGEQNPERIASQAEQAHGRARVFAFGVGYDVNTYLLDRLTAAARGATQYVQSDGEVETALGSLITKISTPVLTDLQLADAPASLREIYPAQLPDLFAGEDLVVFGRYSGGDTRNGRLVITGRRNGVTERFAVDAVFPSTDQTNDFIPRLWASRKIGVLTRTIRLEGATPALEREIRETALRYGILSEYTSYLVQEPAPVVINQPLRGGISRRSDRAPASAPAQASGAGAVRMAAEAQGMREAKSMADLDALAKPEAAMDRSDAGSRRVAGRLFVQRNNIWVEALASDSLRLVTVEPFSQAYFRLLEVLPELKPYVQAFEHVVIAGRNARIEIAAGGVQRLGAGEMDRIVKEFRGR